MNKTEIDEIVQNLVGEQKQRNGASSIYPMPTLFRIPTQEEQETIRASCDDIMAKAKP